FRPFSANGRRVCGAHGPDNSDSNRGRKFPPKHAEAASFITRELFETLIQEAEYFVTHCGAGSVMTGVRLGKSPDRGASAPARGPTCQRPPAGTGPGAFANRLVPRGVERGRADRVPRMAACQCASTCPISECATWGARLSV